MQCFKMDIKRSSLKCFTYRQVVCKTVDPRMLTSSLGFKVQIFGVCYNFPVCVKGDFVAGMMLNLFL